MKMPASGGAPTTIAAGQDWPQGITLDGTSAYWTDSDGGRVMKLTPR
jgi:sugar lactone lactonase YvrE